MLWFRLWDTAELYGIEFYVLLIWPMSVFCNLMVFLSMPVLGRYTIYFQNNEHLISLYKSLSDQFIHYLGTVLYSYSLLLIRHIKKIYSLGIPVVISWMPLYSLLPLFSMLQEKKSHISFYCVFIIKCHVKCENYCIFLGKTKFIILYH